MAKKIIIARFTYEGQNYVGKREVKLYDGDDQMTADANVGLTLRTQRQIRDALRVKKGLKVVPSSGQSVDVSSIESV